MLTDCTRANSTCGSSFCDPTLQCPTQTQHPALILMHRWIYLYGCPFVSFFSTRQVTELPWVKRELISNIKRQLKFLSSFSSWLCVFNVPCWIERVEENSVHLEIRRSSGIRHHGMSERVRWKFYCVKVSVCLETWSGCQGLVWETVRHWKACLWKKEEREA